MDWFGRWWTAGKLSRTCQVVQFVLNASFTSMIHGIIKQLWYNKQCSWTRKKVWRKLVRKIILHVANSLFALTPRKKQFKFFWFKFEDQFYGCFRFLHRFPLHKYLFSASSQVFAMRIHTITTLKLWLFNFEPNIKMNTVKFKKQKLRR